MELGAIGLRTSSWCRICDVNIDYGRVERVRRMCLSISIVFVLTLRSYRLRPKYQPILPALIAFSDGTRRPVRVVTVKLHTKCVNTNGTDLNRLTRTKITTQKKFMFRFFFVTIKNVSVVNGL